MTLLQIIIANTKRQMGQHYTFINLTDNRREFIKEKGLKSFIKYKNASHTFSIP